jgi:homoserine/homoserine lactone efflux protein
MTAQTWFLFCITELILCLIPGPAVLFVLSTALRRGFSCASTAAGGILASNTFYFALSASGIAAVIVASHAVFDAIKWLGAAYLIWLGVRMVFSRAAPHTDATGAASEIRDRVFLRAFVVQSSNPKSLIFFVALLPQFISPTLSVPRQILILGITSILIEFAVLSGYAAIASRARNVAGTRFSQSLERMGGAMLIAAGARLAWIRG